MAIRNAADESNFPTHYAGRTVLAIGAHPDDVELAVGGIAARWSRAGSRVVIAVVTVPGDYARRRREAERAADILGCELRVLAEGGQRIEDLEPHDLVRLLDEQVRELSPAVVLVHGGSDTHRDHVLVHDAAVACQRLRHFDCFSYHPNFCRPVPVTFEPRVYVDISSTIEMKMAAIDAHESQFGGRGITTDIFREIAQLTGRYIGVPYAEGLEINRMRIS
jgi:LmbE family N-acetylglucosaminyl deacetylase